LRIVMALKVRNEADIIDANLRHHLARGVDYFVVTDNSSDDGTREILQRWVDAGLMEVFDETAEDFWSRAHGWVTRMARVAAERHGADWVLHADADEFWMPATGCLKRAFEAVPERYQVVLAPRPEFVPRPASDEHFWERMTIRERYSRLRPKVAHRGLPGVELHQGAHDVALSDDAASSIKHGSRAVTRFPGASGVASDGALAWAPYWPARVMHFPIRSYEQYRKRVETVVFRGDPPMRGARKRLRRSYNNGRLPRSYAKLIADEETIEQELEAQNLTIDERIREALVRSTDPLAAGAQRAEPAVPDPETEAAELAEIEYDAMQSIARSQRLLVRRLDRLQLGSGQRKARINPRAGTLPGRLLLRLRRTL
jgi:hypothetical protein